MAAVITELVDDRHHLTFPTAKVNMNCLTLCFKIPQWYIKPKENPIYHQCIIDFLDYSGKSETNEMESEPIKKFTLIFYYIPFPLSSQNASRVHFLYCCCA